MNPARLLLAVALAALGASCGGGDDDDAAPATTSTSTAATTAPPGSTAATTAPPGSTAAASTLPPYGSPCRPGSHRDCIDADGDGDHEYLEGGADCLERLGAESGLCADLDGDGRAGYPDSG